MTIDAIFDYLFENAGLSDLDEQASVNLDRILLRIMTSPSLVAYLDDVRLSKDGSDQHIVELLFRRFPIEYVETVKKLIAVPSECYEFSQKGRPFLGFKAFLRKKDFNLPNQEHSSGD